MRPFQLIFYGWLDSLGLVKLIEHCEGPSKLVFMTDRNTQFPGLNKRTTVVDVFVMKICASLY